MLIQPIPVSPWQANCYLAVSDENSGECIVVDPGITGAEAIEAALTETGWRPVAILGTHGHIDHVGDAHLVAAKWDVPCYLAAADQHLLTRPGAGLGPHGTALVAQLLGE